MTSEFPDRAKTRTEITHSGQSVMAAMLAALPGRVRFQGLPDLLEAVLQRLDDGERVRATFAHMMALRHLEHPPETYWKRQGAVQEAVRAIYSDPRLPEGWEQAEEEFGGVVRRIYLLGELAQRQERSLEAITAEGFGWDWKAMMPTVPTGGRPRRLLRHILNALVPLVEARVMERGESRPSRQQLAETIAPALRGFFPPEWTDPKSEALRKAIDEAC